MTMKKQIQHSLFILQIILLSACTLSMEEYIVKEEMKGVDEPHTEVTPYGEVTYKYRKNVLPLNGQPQEYIAMMNDSVIWFMDNIPTKWIPREGQYIAANCSQTIPLGLCSKVLSVGREGGMIRVEHQSADENEVFETLVTRLDFEYILPNLGNLDDSTATRAVNRSGFWKNDSTFVDMSFYDNPDTRADEELKPETTNWGFYKYFDLPNNKQLYVDVKFKSTEYVIVHQHKDLENDYLEEWNDSYSEREYELLIGYGNDPESASKSLKSFPKAVTEVRGLFEAIKASNTAMKSMKHEEKIKEISPVVSVPSFPLGVMFRLDVSVGYSLMGYGHIRYKQRTEANRVGYILNKGKEKKLDEPVKISGKEPFSDCDDIYFGGSADVWIRGRVGIGIIVGNQAGGVGGVVGAQLQGGFKAQLETPDFSNYTIVDRQNFKAGLYLTLSGFGEGIAKIGPFSFSLGDFMFNPKELFPPEIFMINMKAVVDDKKTNAKLNATKEEYVLEDENGNPMVDFEGDPVTGVRNVLGINASISFSKLETFFIFPKSEPKNQRVALRIYEGDMLYNTGKYITIHGEDKPLEAKKTYNFDINLNKEGLDQTLNSFTVVPCIYDKGEGIITEYRNNAKVVSTGTPSIQQPKCYEWYARNISEEDWEYYKDIYGSILTDGKDRHDYVEYAFSCVLELRNATRVKEWGVVFNVYNPDNKIILTKDCPVEFEGPCRSGVYTITYCFLSSHKTKSPDSGIDALSVVAKPYCVYDDKKVNFTKSEYINLYYPYERTDGEAYTSGEVVPFIF